MEAKDLRIGNLLEGSNGAVKVDAVLRNNQVQIEGNKSTFIVEGDTPCLIPIKLTEEWLVKFSFEKSIDGFEMSKDITIHDNNGWVKKMVFFQIDDGLCGVSLRDIYDSGEKETYVIEIDIEHVHQLQNLYHSLTGEELTIKED